MILDHTHGAVHYKCHHPDCVSATRRYLKRWRYERSHGLLRLTDPRAVQLHIATLRGHGWSMRAIAGEADVTPTTISRYVNQHSTKVSKATAAKILAIDPATILSRPSKQVTEPFVPRIGTVRRLQALMAIGYSHRDLAERGIDSRNLLNQQGQWVTRSTHDTIAEKYRDLSRRPGPTSRSARCAAKLGYPGPTAWDDIDRDITPELDAPEPGTDFDEVVVLRILAGDNIPASAAERRQVVARWPSTGRTLRDLEQLTGWKTDRYADPGSDAA